MSVADDVTESNPPDRGLARRDFIRKAAVAGAIGWTAPLVLQSLTSPASAASLSGCYRLLLAQASSCTVLAYVVSGTCEPSYGACGTPPNGTGSLATYGIVSSHPCTQTGQTFVFDITTGSCIFVSGRGITTDTIPLCNTGVLTNLNKTITLPNPGSGKKYSEIRLVVTC